MYMSRRSQQMQIKIFFLTRLQTLHTFLAYQFQHHSIEYVRKIVTMKFIFDPEIVSAYLYTCSCLEKCHSFGPSFPSYGNENRSFPLDVPAILIKKNPRRSALSLNTLRGTRNQTVSFTRAISKKRKRFLLVKMLLFTICTSNMSSMRNTEKKIIFLPWTVRKQIFVMYHSHVKIAVSWYFD